MHVEFHGSGAHSNVFNEFPDGTQTNHFHGNSNWITDSYNRRETNNHDSKNHVYNNGNFHGKRPTKESHSARSDPHQEFLNCSLPYFAPSRTNTTPRDPNNETRSAENPLYRGEDSGREFTESNIPEGEEEKEFGYSRFPQQSWANVQNQKGGNWGDNAGTPQLRQCGYPASSSHRDHPMHVPQPQWGSPDFYSASNIHIDSTHSSHQLFQPSYRATSCSGVESGTASRYHHSPFSPNKYYPYESQWHFFDQPQPINLDYPHQHQPLHHPQPPHESDLWRSPSSGPPSHTNPQQPRIKSKNPFWNQSCYRNANSASVPPSSDVPTIGFPPDSAGH